MANKVFDLYKEYPGDHRDIVSPDPILNLVVKSVIADDSAEFPHMKVGHYQVLIESPDIGTHPDRGFFVGVNNGFRLEVCLNSWSGNPRKKKML